jgi:hypothetical protein
MILAARKCQIEGLHLVITTPDVPAASQHGRILHIEERECMSALLQKAHSCDNDINPFMCTGPS